VDKPLVLDGGALIDSGTDQRVAEGHPASRDRDQVRVDRGLESVQRQRDVEDRAGHLEYLRGCRGVVGCRREQQQPGRAGQGRYPVSERALQDGGDGNVPGQRRNRDRVLHRLGQFDERERITLGDVQQAVLACPRQAWGAGVQQGARSVRTERADADDGQFGVRERVPLTVTDARQQGDGLYRQATADESQHVRRRAVKPLRVVGEQDDGLSRRGLGQQVQRGQGYAEPVGPRPRVAERRAQQLRLPVRQPHQPAEQRPDQLVQASERKAGLVPYALGRQDQHAGRLARAPGDRQHRRLADTGRPAQHDRTALGPAGRLQHPGDLAHQCLAPDQPATGRQRCSRLLALRCLGLGGRGHISPSYRLAAPDGCVRC
jgi:hypothetical protein